MVVHTKKSGKVIFFNIFLLLALALGKKRKFENVSKNSIEMISLIRNFQLFLKEARRGLLKQNPPKKSCLFLDKNKSDRERKNRD